MARSNRKDPGFIVLREKVDRAGRVSLDRTFKAQHFDARADARDFAKTKNDARRKLDKRFTVLPVYPGPINRKK